MADSVTITYEKGKLYDLAVTDLQPDTEQPRKYFDEQALAELKASIEKHGVLQPVLFRQGTNGGLLLVSGERRYQASKLAGCGTIPAIFTDGDPAEISIVENLLRENLTAIEEAEAIDRLKTQHNYQLSELSTILGKSDSTISEILSLNKLPEEVKSDCRNDPKTARGILAAIAKQKDPTKMTALYAKYKENGLTRGEILKKTRKPKPADAPIDLGFINVFTDKMEAVDLTKLDQTHRETMQVDLEKMRSSSFQILKILKG